MYINALSNRNPETELAVEQEQPFRHSAPLLELLLSSRAKTSARQRRAADASASADPRQGVVLPLRRPHPPKQLFLSEFELRGTMAEAALAAGCSLTEVRMWRTNDAKFARDFTLAAIGHLRMLRQLVLDIAGDGTPGPTAESARHLLASEPHYRDGEGRLDVRAWRDALAAFVSRHRPDWRE
ncbi:MAG: hypothetical protein ACYDAG_15365, partial [Chloroflexota bacterium]